MGVRGLLSYVLRHADAMTQRVDLAQEAQYYGRNGVTLLVDILDFCARFLPEVDRGAKGWEGDATLQVCGSDFVQHDEALCELIFALRHAGIYLEFFLDPPRGCGLLDAATSAWTEEAKRRCSQGLEAAKAVRQWCRGERNDLPNLAEARCLAPLFYEQVVATLTRCGCQVWHLNADEQSPLLQTRRGSEWSHVWGIVSDNIDWTVCQGVKLIPLQFFDLDGIVKLKSMEGAGMGWPEVDSFSVAYTSSDVIAEYLRLGHPPKEEDLKEYERKGKSKGSFGRRGWPMKWWYDSVLIELALLFGTDATTPFIQKHKLYQQIGLRMGQDPIESITRWFRDQLYSRKLRWKDVYLEALSPVLADLAEKDSDFGLALQCSRKVYEQDARSLRNVVMNLERQRRQNGEKAVAIDSSLHQANQERAKELPVTSSLLLRSAALADKVWLDVHLEDVSRLGAPVSTQLFSDLRRVLYQLLGRDSITETKGDHSGVTASKMVLSDAGSLPDAKAVQRWTWSHRWQMFRAIVEHNLVHVKRKNEKSHPAPEGAESAEPVEIVVHRTFKENQSDDAVPDWAHGSFAAIVLEYVASLNQRPEQPMIREHEFDTLAATLALCCDTALPGAPLGRASAQVQQRMYQVKELLYNHITTHFHANSEIRLPPRGASVATYFQTAAHLLMDIARLLWLDADFGHGSMVFLPEPREIFSAQIFAALYMAGAYEAWELSFPEGDSAWQWEEIMNQLVELRHEVLWCQPFRTWREELLWSLRPGVIAWPTERQLDEERKKSSHVEELPIDEHRDKILKHIETHRVTCIQGETGCGKSTRVPVYVMEEYLEKRRAGKVSKEDKFMVLCTQPRRIACISLANRVASCIKETVGDSIGYKISGDSKVRPGRTKLVYVTTGYLLQVLVNNPEQISSYTHLILDEVHERDVDSDLLSLVVKLQMSGYGFKLVIMSATLQGDLFTRYFSEKKIKTIFVGVKRYPVEVVHIEQLLDRFGGRSGDFMMKSEGTRGYQAPFAGNAYRAIKDAERAFGTGGREAEGWEEENVKVKGEFDSDSDDESGDSDFSTEETAAVAKAMAAPKRRRKEVSPNIIRGLDTLVYELILRVAQPGEGILVFLPGIGEISELQEALMPLEDVDQQAHMNWSPGLERNDLHFKVFVLHSLIPKDEQEGAVFDPPPPDTAHIILASNIAESSLTIPKVRIVIDFGLRRQLIYDKRRHMSCLVTTWVSQASAKQRCGRTGRVFEGVNIRLYTKQFFDSYMDEFDPPEMQTAPLEKLYVNVKHLSAKLPAYQVTPTEFRKRTPKELLMLVAQPPEESAIASSIENLDQLGALTSDSESAELTVLGYLMMAVPLDVQLCRLVIFGALLGMPCEGVVCAAAASVQDPFTLPSHLIMKDPKEYAEAVRRSYESRKYFDHGHWSEPLMLRNLFVHFLLEFRKMQIDKCNRRGRVGRESTRSAFTRCAQLMASKFAVVPKRLVNLANAILDTATRMKKFLPEGSALLKQLESLLSLLQAGERVYSSVEAAEDLFCSDAWKLKALLVMAFTPQFMRGGTKVRAPDQQVTVYTKKKKQTATKEKNKMEILLQEIVDLGLDPTRTVACVLELPRGKGGVRMNPRFTDDLHLTVQMITGEGFHLVMAKDNRVLISFEDVKEAKQEDEEADGAGSSLRPRPKPDPFANIKTEPCCTLSEEVGLVTGISTGAHYIDLFGAGRWKFPVNLLSSLKKEQEERARRKAAEADAKRKAAAEAEAKRKAEEKATKKAKKAALQEAANASPKSLKDEDSNKAEEPEVKAPDAEASGSLKETQETEVAPKSSLEDAKAPTEVSVVAASEAEAKPEQPPHEALALAEATKATGPSECSAPDASPAQASAEASADDTTEGAKVPEAEKSPSVQPGHESKDGTLLAEHEHEHEETDGEEHEFGETAHLVELEAEEDPEFEQEDVDEEDAEEEEEEVYKEEEIGPPINIYKPVTPYEVNWEITEVPAEGSAGGTQGSKKVGKVVKPKVTKGRCQWRNPVGFMCSTDTSEAAEHEPWPNDMYAVYTSTQGGDSKDMSWVEGVTLLSSEGHNIMAFILLMAFLRDHQELYVDVDLMDGRIYSMKGPGGLELTPAEDQVLLCEDIEVINDVRKALSEAFYSKAPPKITTVEGEDGIDFSGTRGRRDDEPVPQVAAEPRVSEALDRLFEVLRECSTRMESIDEETWDKRIRLSKPTRQIIPLHQQSSRKAASSDALFTLFEPLTDLAQARAAAERQELEEAERRRKAEEEKRRRKEMERQAKEEARRQKQQEQQRAREEAKRAKGKGKGKDEAKGKGKKDRKQQQSSYGQQYQQYQPQQPQQQQQPQNSKKGRRGAAQSSTAASSSDAQGLQQVYTMPDLPADWVAVPDQQTGRPYFWNPQTGEVTWTKPGPPMMMPPMPTMFQPPMFFQQQ